MNNILPSPPATHPLWYERSPVPTPLGIAVHLGWLNGEPSADGVAIKSLRTPEMLQDPALHREYMLTRSFVKAAAFRRCGHGRARPIPMSSDCRGRMNRSKS